MCVRRPNPIPCCWPSWNHGEAAVISLARECRPCTVIIDERGRRIAGQVYGLPVRGTAGLLVAACRQGWLADLREVLMALRRDGYYLSDAVIEAACRALDGG